MSDDPNDPKFAPGPDRQPDDRAPERGGSTPERSFEPRSGFRPLHPQKTGQSAQSRPSPPWDLTTRVPAANARHANPEDLTLFAMQLLSGEEAGAIAEHVEHCAECRRELAQIRGDLGTYAFTVETHTPSDAARDRLLRQISREKKAIPISHSRSAAIATFGRTTSILTPTEDEEAQRPSRIPVILAWTGWAAAAALAVTAGAIYRDRDVLRSAAGSQASQIARLSADSAQAHRLMDAIIDPHAQRVTLTTKPLAPAPIGRATYDPEKGTLVFLASDMEPVQPDKTYELWLIPADGSASLPAGTFRPDETGNASVIMPSLPKGIQAKGFGVTIEDEGGSQTPTKPIVMSGF